MKKVVGHGQLPDLGMQLFQLLFVDLWSFRVATLENARRAFKQRTLPAVDHRRVNAKLACKRSNRPLTLQCLKRNFGLELRRMVRSRVHVGSSLSSCDPPLRLVYISATTSDRIGPIQQSMSACHMTRGARMLSGCRTSALVGPNIAICLERVVLIVATKEWTMSKTTKGPGE